MVADACSAVAQLPQAYKIAALSSHEPTRARIHGTNAEGGARRQSRLTEVSGPNQAPQYEGNRRLSAALRQLIVRLLLWRTNLSIFRARLIRASFRSAYFVLADQLSNSCLIALYGG